jgi:hypothetical protein
MDRVSIVAITVTISRSRTASLANVAVERWGYRTIGGPVYHERVVSQLGGS